MFSKLQLHLAVAAFSFFMVVSPEICAAPSGQGILYKRAKCDADGTVLFYDPKFPGDAYIRDVCPTGLQAAPCMQMMVNQIHNRFDICHSEVEVMLRLRPGAAIEAISAHHNVTYNDKFKPSSEALKCFQRHFGRHRLTGASSEVLFAYVKYKAGYGLCPECKAEYLPPVCRGAGAGSTSRVSRRQRYKAVQLIGSYNERDLGMAGIGGLFKEYMLEFTASVLAGERRTQFDYRDEAADSLTVTNATSDVSVRIFPFRLFFVGAGLTTQLFFSEVVRKSESDRDPEAGATGGGKGKSETGTAYFLNLSAGTGVMLVIRRFIIEMSVNFHSPTLFASSADEGDPVRRHLQSKFVRDRLGATLGFGYQLK